MDWREHELRLELQRVADDDRVTDGLVPCVEPSERTFVRQMPVPGVEGGEPRASLDELFLNCRLLGLLPAPTDWAGADSDVHAPLPRRVHLVQDLVDLARLEGGKRVQHGVVVQIEEFPVNMALGRLVTAHLHTPSDLR